MSYIGQGKSQDIISIYKDLKICNKTKELNLHKIKTNEKLAEAYI